MAVIGIDLGTTNSLAGVWQDGKVVLIPNAFGEYLTPSVVGIGKNQEVFVGSVAKEMLATQPYDTFREFKRNMGTNFLYGNGRKRLSVCRRILTIISAMPQKMQADLQD